jgi:hypothetical protein
MLKACARHEFKNQRRTPANIMSDLKTENDVDYSDDECSPLIMSNRKKQDGQKVDEDASWGFVDKKEVETENDKTAGV